MPFPLSMTLTGFNPAGIGDDAFSVDALGFINLGKRVDRLTEALPASTVQTPLFTVSGGRIVLTSIVGLITTVVQTQACNAKLIANPASGTDLDICADLNISAKAAGTLFTITGTLATALQNVGVGALLQAAPLIIPAGTIDLLCSATNTGAVQWTVHYVPLDDDATVVTA